MFFGFAAFASAQTASRNSSVTTRAVSTTSKTVKKKNVKPSDTLNNRKAYMFKNGQRSTPTGAEATASSVGGQFASLGRKKAPAVKKDTTAPARTPATKKQ